MNYQFPPLNDEYVFEEFVKDAFNCKFNDSSFQPYGTRGQKQNGIDIFSTTKKIVIQCKKKDIRRYNKDVINELKSEINKSLIDIKELKIEFDNFYIVSTAKRHVAIQDYVSDLSSKKSFNIYFWGWDDLQPLINEYKYLREKFYPNKAELRVDEGEYEHNLPDDINKLIGEINNYLDQKDAENALSTIKIAQVIAKNKKNKFALTELSLKKAEVYYEILENYSEALLLLDNCSTNFKNNKEKLAYTYYLIGSIFIFENELEEAEAKLNQSLNIYLNIENESGLSRCLHQLGWVNDKLGNIDLALDFYKKSLSKTRTASSINEKEKISGIGACYHHIALLYRRKGNSLELESNILKAITWFEKGNFIFELAQAKYVFGEHKFKEGEAEKAFELIIDAIEIYLKLKNHQRVSESYVYLSQMYYSCGNKAKAFEVINLVLEYSVKNELNDKKIGYYLIKTGRLFLEIRQEKIANQYFEKAKEFFLEKKYLLGYADSFLAFSQMEYQLGNMENAIDFRIKAKDIFISELPKTITRHETATLAGRIGSICEEIGMYQEALVYYSKAIKIFEEIGNIYSLALMLGNIVTCNRLLGVRSEEEITFRRIIDLVEGTSFYYIKASAVSNLADIEFDKGNINLANKLHEEAFYLAEKYNIPNKYVIIEAYKEFKNKHVPKK